MSRLGLSLILFSWLLLTYDTYGYGSRRAPQLQVIQYGVASWYGREEEGKRTASGELFNRHNFTAAHRHLPFNTLVRVTNRKNGRTVEVRINDRGPFGKGRILDLSEAAANTLDMKKSGVTPVEIQIMKTAPEEPRGTPSP